MRYAFEEKKGYWSKFLKESVFPVAVVTGILLVGACVGILIAHTGGVGGSGAAVPNPPMPVKEVVIELPLSEGDQGTPVTLRIHMEGVSREDVNRVWVEKAPREIKQATPEARQ